MATPVIEDITYDGPDGLPVQAYLVRPDGGGSGDSGGTGSADLTPPGPAILAWHWLDSEAPDGDRTEFLDEAAAWAEHGITTLLPQGRFPWHDDPTGSAADRAAILAEVGRLRAGLDLLEARPDVDPARLAVVGHDFGGMLAIVAAADETRLRGLVVVAATPRWGDWFLPFWVIDGDRIDYLRALRDLDPIERIGQAAPAEVLLQLGERDYFIAAMAGFEFRRAAPDGSASLAYDSGHDMRLPEIRADRLAFLLRVLGLPAEPTTPA
jgi:dienelactone hydrolase